MQARQNWKLLNEEGIIQIVHLCYSTVSKKNWFTEGQNLLVSQIMAQRTKVNPREILRTKVDIVSFAMPNFRTSVLANHLIYSLQSSRLDGSVFLLVLGLGPFGLYHCPYPSGLALNHISTNLTWCSIPFHQHLPPSSSTPAGGPHRHWAATWGVATHIQMGWGWVTAGHFKTMTLIHWNHFWSLLKGVFRVIILLKGEPRCVQPIKLHNSQEFNLKNAGVQLSTHSPIYHAHIIHSLGRCAAPNHQESAPKLDDPLVWLCFRADPGLFHTQALPFDPILLILVSHDQFTLPQSSRVQCWCSKAPLPMSPWKKWPFLLYDSLETCLSWAVITVWRMTLRPESLMSCEAVSAAPEVTLWARRHWSLAMSCLGCPPGCLGRLSLTEE